MLKRVRKRILREIFQAPVFRITSELAYKAALEKYAGNIPLLSPTDLALVNTFKREGIVVTSLEALGIPSTPLLIKAAKKLLPTIPKTFSSNKSEYVVHATSAQIMEYPELFLWGLEERLLNIAENCIGLPVAYHGLYFRRDLDNKIQVKSRQWHIDREDRCIIKVIVYLNDVSDSGGPFEYIPKPLTSLLSRSLKYNYGYIPDEAVKPVIPTSEWKPCLGPSGTVIFADTASIFHRGKLPVGSDRFTLFFDYTSRQPKNPWFCKSSLSEDELLLLAPRLSKRQRKCIFWREGERVPRVNLLTSLFKTL